MDEIRFVESDVQELSTILDQAYNAIGKFYEMYEGLFYSNSLATDCDEALQQLLDVQSDILDATTAVEECAGLLD
jgi:hypothetical protein